MESGACIIYTAHLTSGIQCVSGASHNMTLCVLVWTPSRNDFRSILSPDKNIDIGRFCKNLDKIQTQLFILTSNGNLHMATIASL